MSTPPRPAPAHVPILTEVIDLPAPTPVPPAAVAEPVLAPTPVAAAPAPGASVLDEAQIAQRVLADVQRQIDGMLEFRLREALAPILHRTAEALVRELRQELSRTMRDVVARSVAQEVARNRSRQ